MYSTLLISVVLSGNPSDAATLSTESMQKAVDFVTEDQPKLSSGGGCTNCHHTAFRVWSLREAARAGWTVDKPKLEAQTDLYLKRLQKQAGSYHKKNWSHSLAMFFVMAQQDDVASPVRRKAIDALTQIIIDQQGDNGTWQSSGQFGNQRRPKPEREFTQTLWGVVALSRAGSQEGAVAARNNALNWLKSAPEAVTIDTRVLEVLVEDQHGTPERTDSLLATLLKTQHEDGGWGWQVGDISDAWATGFVLWGLTELSSRAMGDGSSLDAAITRARSFLARTQRKDATWYVEKKNKIVKSSEMATYFGTLWAVIAIARTQPETGAAVTQAAAVTQTASDRKLDDQAGQH